MSVTLRRAAYSTNIKTRRDLSCAVFDRELAASSPSRSASRRTSGRWPTSCRGCLAALTGRSGCGRATGSSATTATSAGSTSTTSPLVAPVFHDGRLVAYVANIAHHLDVGGGTPGSIGLPRDLSGRPDHPALALRRAAARSTRTCCALILRNVRAPRETAGDFRAQTRGERDSASGAWSSWSTGTAPAGLATRSTSSCDYTERRTRAASPRAPARHVQRRELPRRRRPDRRADPRRGHA